MGTVDLPPGCEANPPGGELRYTPSEGNEFEHGQHVSLSHCPVYPKPGEPEGEFAAGGSLASPPLRPARRLAPDPRHPVSLEEYIFPEKIHLDRVPECSAVVSRSQTLASRSAADQSPRVQNFMTGDSRDKAQGSTHSRLELSENNRHVCGLTPTGGEPAIPAGAAMLSNSRDRSPGKSTRALQEKELRAFERNEEAEVEGHTHEGLLSEEHSRATVLQQNAGATGTHPCPDPVPGSSPSSRSTQWPQAIHVPRAAAALDALKQSERKGEGGHEHSRDFQAGTDLLRRRNSTSGEIGSSGFDAHSNGCKAPSPRPGRTEVMAGVSSGPNNCAVTHQAGSVPIRASRPVREEAAGAPLRSEEPSRAESGDSFAQQPPQRLHLRDRLHLPALLLCRSPVGQHGNSRSPFLPVSPWRVLTVPSRVTKIRVASTTTPGCIDRPVRYRRRGRGSTLRKPSLRRSSSAGQTVRRQGRRHDESGFANKEERIASKRAASISPMQQRRSRYRRPDSSRDLSAGSRASYTSEASPACTRRIHKTSHVVSPEVRLMRRPSESTGPACGVVSGVAFSSGSCPRCNFPLGLTAEERKPDSERADWKKADEFPKDPLEKVVQRDPPQYGALLSEQSGSTAKHGSASAQDSYGQPRGQCWFCRIDTRDEKNPPCSSTDILFRKYLRQIERLERKQEALRTDTEPEVEQLQQMVTKSTRLVYFLIIVNIAVLLLCFFFALFPIHLTGKRPTGRSCIPS